MNHYHWLGAESDRVPLVLTDCIADPRSDLQRMSQLQYAQNAPYWQQFYSQAVSPLTQMLGHPGWRS